MGTTKRNAIVIGLIVLAFAGAIVLTLKTPGMPVDPATLQAQTSYLNAKTQNDQVNLAGQAVLEDKKSGTIKAQGEYLQSVPPTIGAAGDGLIKLGYSILLVAGGVCLAILIISLAISIFGHTAASTVLRVANAGVSYHRTLPDGKVSNVSFTSNTRIDGDLRLLPAVLAHTPGGDADVESGDSVRYGERPHGHPAGRSVHNIVEQAGLGDLPAFLAKRQAAGPGPSADVNPTTKSNGSGSSEASPKGRRGR